MRCSRKRNRDAIDAGSFSWEVASQKPEMKFLELEPYQSEGQKQNWKRAVRSQAAKAAHHTRRMKDPSFAQHRRTARIERKQSLTTPSRPSYAVHASAPASVVTGDSRSECLSPTRSPQREGSSAPSQAPIYCLGPALTGMKPPAPAPAPEPSHDLRVHQAHSEHFSPYFAAAFQESQYAPSSIYGDVSPCEQQPPIGISTANSSFGAYNAWPEIMLTPPAEEEVPYSAPTRTSSIDDQADRHCLLQALQSANFSAFAKTDPALQSSVDMAVKTLNNHDVTGLSEDAKTVLDAESLAICEVHTALNDQSRATSDQLLASVSIMALGAICSGNMATFCRHTAGLLDMLAARSNSLDYRDGTFSPGHDRTGRSLSLY